MITHPTARELTRSVAQWIDSVRSELDPRHAYLARVAMHSLAIVERELEQGAVAKEKVAAQLKELLGLEGDYESLTNELCERLRTGQATINTPGLLSVLKIDASAKLNIDQPNYRTESGSE